MLPLRDDDLPPVYTVDDACRFYDRARTFLDVMAFAAWIASLKVLTYGQKLVAVAAYASAKGASPRQALRLIKDKCHPDPSDDDAAYDDYSALVFFHEAPEPTSPLEFASWLVLTLLTPRQKLLAMAAYCAALGLDPTTALLLVYASKGYTFDPPLDDEPGDLSYGT